MRIIVVRHGQARSKKEWTAPDWERPLVTRGARQADLLDKVLGGDRPDRVISSPALRCIQTVQPLAARYGVPVELTRSLAPDAGAQAVELCHRLLAGDAGDAGDASDASYASYAGDATYAGDASIASDAGETGEAADLEDPTIVLCTHREVMVELLPRLAREAGRKLGHRTPGAKGGAWILPYTAGRLHKVDYRSPGA